MKAHELAAARRVALVVACPTCKAVVGAECTTKYGARTDSPHAPRVAVGKDKRWIERSTKRFRMRRPGGHA